MNQAIILDMPTLTAQSLGAHAAASSFVDRLLASVTQLLSLTTDPVEELLDRAEAYEETQPNFAEELRAAAKAITA